MTDLWMPGASRVAAPSHLWGNYSGDTPYRGALHTTETDYYPPSSSSYFGGTSYPHSTIGEAKDGTRGIFQHIPINRAARALKNKSGGVETNNAHVVQCEIVWRASNAAAMPSWLLDLVATWMRWVEATVDVERRALPFYGQGCGWVVASAGAPQRMSAAEWNAFNGWCGHQHVPENDHWDPGAIPIDKLIGVAPSPFPNMEEPMDIYIPTDMAGNQHKPDGVTPIGPQILVQGNRRIVVDADKQASYVKGGAVVHPDADPHMIEAIAKLADDVSG